MYVEDLISIASPRIAHLLKRDASFSEWHERGERFRELAQLLSARNGFYAFEAALHVLPWTASVLADDVMGIQEWNEKSTWRDWYQALTDGVLFFAEDVFGGQFGIRGDEIVSFEPESGDVQVLATSLEDWAKQLLSDYGRLTGQPVAHSWQFAHGPIPIGKRLLPKTPFILGGAFDERNLYAVDAIKGMRYRGELWQQLRDLPDGAQVRLKALPLQ